MKKLIGLILAALIGVSIFTSCDTGSGLTDYETPDTVIDKKNPTTDYVKYPYLYHNIKYIGKATLDQSSSYILVSNSEKSEGMDSVLNTYAGPDNVLIDNLSYGIIGNYEITTGGVPKIVFDQFWNDLKNYSSGLWSIWEFIYCVIPSKGSDVEFYIIYAMVDNKYSDSVWYFAAKGIAAPQ
jgi:hypothetical protein